MSGTGASSAARRYLSPVGDEAAQFLSVFVVYHLNLTGTKGTDLTTGYISRSVQPYISRSVRSRSNHFLYTLRSRSFSLTSTKREYPLAPIRQRRLHRSSPQREERLT